MLASIRGRPLEEITEADFLAHFTTNVQGSFFTTQAAARYLGHGGRIIYVSSGLARRITPLCSVYAATKAAVEAITRSQAAELAKLGPGGITVNAVAPGIVDTPMLRTSLTSAEKNDLIRATALGRVGEPDDIARVIAFLASDDAGWISGQVIDVDGGLA
jgi:3-oxoacyl-[acyl-carrier protein] reductase